MGDSLLRFFAGLVSVALSGSLHCLPDGEQFAEPFELLTRYSAEQVLRDYLAEIPQMVVGSELLGVVTHIDYPV